MHSLFLFFGSDYFANSYSEYRYLYDYEWLYLSMENIKNYWSEFGFLAFPENYFSSDKNVFLIPYFSLLFFLGKNTHFLNISILNSYHNILVAFLVAIYISIHSTRKHAQNSFLIALIQPFGFSLQFFGEIQLDNFLFFRE